MPQHKQSGLSGVLPKNAQKKITALVISMAVVLIIGLASSAAAFDLMNGIVRDALMRINLNGQASERLIVIEAERATFKQGDEVWLTALQNLLAHDVKQLVFTFFPAEASETFYQAALRSGKVTFGRQAAALREAPDAAAAFFSGMEKDAAPAFGLLGMANSEHGVFRRQFGTVEADNAVYPGLEYLAARRVLGEAAQLPESDYLINFTGGTARLPKIGMQRVLSGGLVNELIRGKTVLIGINGLEPVAELYTPISEAEGQISDLLFHGFALDTLLSERQIIVLPQWAALLLLLFTMFGSLFGCQWLSFQFSALASLGMSAVYGMLCWFLLHAFSLWLPITELWLAWWSAFVIVWSYKIVVEKRELDKTLLELSVKLQEKVFPVSFYRSEDPWTQLTVMVNQTLHLNRIIFLERVVADHRLREIKALNCSIDDIHEKRRDYERTPYSTAISENRPILLEQTFFKEVPGEERQYLAPLIFAGDVLGFWAFTIESDKIRLIRNFAAITHDYMEQISEMLHYRREALRQMETENNQLWRYLRIEGGGVPYKILHQSVELLEKRAAVLQEVFNNLNTCSILYDLFGRVLLVNRHMEELAQSLQLRPFNMTILDFVVALTGYDFIKARSLLQQTIFEHEVAALPVKLGENQQNYMLYIRPLNGSGATVSDEPIPKEDDVFEMRGVLCELADISELRQVVQLKNQMFERVCFQMRNDFSSLLLALAMLADKGTPEDEKASVFAAVQQKVDETLRTLSVVKEKMNIEIEHLADNKLECYPVDGRKPVELAVKRFSENTASRGIKMHLQLPQIFSLVFASPYELQSVLNTVLSVLVEDAYQFGNVWIEVEEKQGYVCYRMHNDGTGIPAENLRQFLDAEADVSGEAAKLRHAIESVSGWGGTLDISSQVGKGSRAELKLKCFP
jgi:signal transduction histidine kinase